MTDRPIYMISVAAELVGVHPQTLRQYEDKGLVRPKRTPGGTRLYSEADVERLRIIQRLTTEVGLNLAGVELVLRLEDELRRSQTQIEHLQKQLREEVQKVHKEYRRDLVLYRPSTGQWFAQEFITDWKFSVSCGAIVALLKTILSLFIHGVWQILFSVAGRF